MSSAADLDAEEEVFLDCGASPELRRSTRTSARKRSSTGFTTESNPRPKKDRKMSTARTPVNAKTQAGPSSAAKAVPPSDSVVADPVLVQMQAMLSGMESRLSMATVNLQTSVTGAIGELKDRVGKTEERLDNMAGEIGGLVDSKIQEGLRKLGIPTGDQDAGPKEVQDSSAGNMSSYAAVLSSTREQRLTLENKGESNYSICRRSLRLRPIKIEKDVQDTDLVKAFMGKYLRMDSGAVERLGPFSVTRVPYGPKTRHKDEAVVRFSSVEARDVVRSAASNLAGHGQEIGIRLEIPARMRAAMRALQSISYEIKTKHPGSRRNILFDDDTCELALDFSTEEGKPWRRLTTAQAMAKKKPGGPSVRSRLDDGELDEILGRGDESEASGGQSESQGRPTRSRRGFGYDDEDIGS